jgi:hypothetical protein
MSNKEAGYDCHSSVYGENLICQALSVGRLDMVSVLQNVWKYWHNKAIKEVF